MKAKDLASLLNQHDGDMTVLINLHGKLYEIMPTEVGEGEEVTGIELFLDTPPALHKFEAAE